MKKLNDTQAILLANAAQHDSGSIYPLPEGLVGQERAQSAITSLTKCGLIEERGTADRTAICRIDGDHSFGLFVTAAGLAAINVSEEAPDQQSACSEHRSVAAAKAPERGSKISSVLGLLERTDGATMAELVEATGWLPHTTRAALTGLRKKGHAITTAKRGDMTCYSIASAA